MRSHAYLGVALFAGVVLCSAGIANAQETILTFAFSELDGDFNATSLVFTAADDGDTDGELTRLVPIIGDAFLAANLTDGGFPPPASFSLAMTLSNVTATTASVLPGDGVLTIADINGDSFVGGLSGSWVYNGSANFVGLITDLTPVTAFGDGRFDGTSGPGFSMSFPGGEMFDGNVMTLAFNSWFTDGSGTPTHFSDATTLAVGAVVPEPVTLSLLAVGGLALLARRRR